MAEVEMQRPWFWEGHVQAAVGSHLERAGWVVREAADTESKAPGIDLLADLGDRWLAIEVKGYPNTTYSHGPKRGEPKPTQPTNQARQWFSHALLGMMLLRDKRPDAEIALCFPRFTTYENLVGRSEVSFGLLGFGIYFVNEDGSVDLAVPHHSVHRVAPAKDESVVARPTTVREVERGHEGLQETPDLTGGLQRGAGGGG